VPRTLLQTKHSSNAGERGSKVLEPYANTIQHYFAITAAMVVSTLGKHKHAVGSGYSHEADGYDGEQIPHK
jgi:hypothetical protein